MIFSIYTLIVNNRHLTNNKLGFVFNSGINLSVLFQWIENVFTFFTFIHLNMDSEKYRIAWQPHSDHLKSMMKGLMMSEDFADVTLVTEDKKHIKAHRNILSSWSPFFREIFQKKQ